MRFYKKAISKGGQGFTSKPPVGGARLYKRFYKKAISRGGQPPRLHGPGPVGPITIACRQHECITP
eukprot:scaffold195385_cov22-Tisochrysis_lutea.AAC.2